MRAPCAVLLVALASSAPAAERNPRGAGASRAAPEDLVEMEVRGVRQVGDSRAHAVVLSPRGEERMVPIFIGEAEAVAIGLRLGDQRPPRPLTHDLLENVIRTLGARLVRVEVDDLTKTVYLGRLHFVQGEKSIQIDARPSDAIALALGLKAPIFAARKVVEAAALDPKGGRREGDL